MQIGGLQKVSLIDWPGKIAAVVFLIGCNFRCPFCQNPELVETKQYSVSAILPRISQIDFFAFLESREKLLEGVSVTGGEPTINPDLPEFLEKIKKIGFSVKLDTNASNPKMLEELISKKMIDYFAVDIKASPKNYLKTIGLFYYPERSRRSPANARNSLNKLRDSSVALLFQNDILKNIEKSLDIIQKSGIPFEFRTTAVPGIIDEKEMNKIKKWLKNLGVLEKAKIYAIQQFRSEKTLDKSFEKIKPYSNEKLEGFANIIKPEVRRVEIRGI